jgi:VCBS repeat-containing protein
MGHSTTYTATGSTTDSYSGNGVLFIQVPVSYSTTGLGAATVSSFDVHLSSQSGNDVLSIQTHTSTWDGNTESVTVSGNQVLVNNTVYGTYSFSNQDLVFTFSSGNSNPDIIGAIMDAVAYQNTAPARPTAQTETVSWSFNPSGTTAPSDTINVLPPTTTYTGTGTSIYPAAYEILLVDDTPLFVEAGSSLGSPVLTYSVTNGAAAVTSFDADLQPLDSGFSAQFDALSIQNRTTTWDGNSESVTTSGDQVYVNNTLYGTYSFSGHDLVFTFGSANSNPDILGAILDAVAVQTTGAETEYGQDASISFSFTSSGVVTAPSAYVVVPVRPDFAFAPQVTTVATYPGSPVYIQPVPASGSLFQYTSGGDAFQVRDGLITVLQVSIVNPHAGDELLYTGVTAGFTGHGDGTGHGDSWGVTGVAGYGTTAIELTFSAAQFWTYAGGVLQTFLESIEYENTSATPPSSAQIQVKFDGLTSVDELNTVGFFQDLTSVSAPTVSFDPTLTVDLTPLPTVTTESATVTSGGAVSGTAGTGAISTGALANDSDANAGFTLSVSAVTGGTLGSALHGTYGDLTLNADGSFSYTADATTTEAAAIAAATGQVTDAFTYSVSDGHGGVSSATLDIKLDATKPSISSIAFSPSSGDLAVHASETITLSLANVGAIDIAGGGPTLTLNDGGTATYDVAASTSTSWVFDYTVGASDTDVASLAVNSVNLNGTTLTNPSGVATVTSLPVTVTQSGPQIDTTTPAFTTVTENPSSGEIGLNSKVTFTLTLNDPVTVDTTHGAPTLSLNDNGTATYDAAHSTGTSLVFDYTLSGTDIANVTSLQATLFNLNDAVIANGAGTAADISLAGLSQSGPQIDLPQLTGGLAQPSSGTYGVGETMGLLLEISKAITVTGSGITLSLNDGGTATLDVANTAALEQFGLVAFDYHVAPTDHDVGSLAVTGVTLNGGTILDSLGDEAQFSGALPTFNNVEIDTGIACYCGGTLIEAARGQKKVEALNIGDKVRTASGALRPIKWIGRRSYAGRFVMGRNDILPVCIKAGALADNVPARDLWVSPNHAMFLSGVLIEAKNLVNGVSIVQAEAVESVEYFHIELDTHDVIIAEGALSETFIDDDSRGMFHNAHDYDTLYAQVPAAAAHYCAPRLDEGYEVEAVRQRLALRAGLLRSADAPQLGALRGYIDRIRSSSIAGWAQSADAPEAAVCLDILADGKLIGQVLANAYREDLKAAGLGSGRHAFVFAAPAGLVFAPDTVEVRRSLDGAGLLLSGQAKRVLLHQAAA